MLISSSASIFLAVFDISESEFCRFRSASSFSNFRFLYSAFSSFVIFASFSASESLSSVSACHFSCALVTAVFTAFWTLRSNSARFSACPRKSSNDISLPLSPEPAPVPSSFPSPAPLPSPSPSANTCRLIIGILQ